MPVTVQVFKFYVPIKELAEFQFRKTDPNKDADTKAMRAVKN